MGILLQIPYSSAMKIATRHSSTWALLLGFVLFFNAFTCCMLHGSAASARLNGVEVAFCSLTDQKSLSVSLVEPDSVAGAALVMSQDCQLCSSGMLLTSAPGASQTPIFPFQPVLGRLPDSPPVDSLRHAWPPANPRASPRFV